MFKPQFLFNQNVVQEQREKAVSKNEQCDNFAAMQSSQSTTELYIEPQRASGDRNSSKQERPSSIRRCISYQYVHMSNEHVGDSTTEPIASGSGSSGNQSIGNSSNNNNIPKRYAHSTQQPSRASSTKCKCCESSQCPSPRSSDSGMAGSCTITSPDPPLINDTQFGNYYIGEVLPMPETTNCATDDMNDLTRFDVCGMFRAKFLTPEATQDLTDNAAESGAEHKQRQYGIAPTTSAAIKMAPLSTITTAELEISASSTTINSVASNSSHQLMTGSVPNMQFSSSLDDTDTTAGASTVDGRLFRSGMYAHWWKKEKLPPAVVRGIAKALQLSQPSKDSRCSMCSSCTSCVSGGGSGFSEGTDYSSLCRECVCFCRRNSGAPSNTNTTTTTSVVNCPLCSADDDAATDAQGSPGHSDRLSRMSFSNGGAITATTTSTSTVSSPTSSLDCPVCRGLIACGESTSSIRIVDTAVENSVDSSSSSLMNNSNSSSSAAVVEGKHCLLTHSRLSRCLTIVACWLCGRCLERRLWSACAFSIVLPLVNNCSFRFWHLS